MSMTEQGVVAKAESAKSEKAETLSKPATVNLQDPFSIHSSMAGLVKELKVVAQIDGHRSHGPVPFREFCEVNSDMGEELKLIADALARNGVYQGGGGGAPIFTVRIALASALEIFNGAFDYCFVMPIDRVDVEGAIELAKLRGRDDIARQLISGLAALPVSDRVIVRAPGMRQEQSGPPSSDFGAVNKSEKTVQEVAA